MTKQTIWVTGAKGILGPAIIKELSKNVQSKIIGTDMDVDITDMDAVKQFMTIYRPSVIINCAALSNAKTCEENRIEAYKVNALGARNLAIAANKANCKLIHLSTDDVFDGKKEGTWNEFDLPRPLSVYAKSKYAGEQYVSSLCPKHLIIRSSWLYGNNSAKDFFAFVVEKGKAGESFEVPVNKLSTPTSSDELCRFICKVINYEEYGIYHAACEGTCTRHEFAQAILMEMGLDVTLAKGIFAEGESSSTLLENLMMQMTNVYEMPNWRDAMKDYVKAMK